LSNNSPIAKRVGIPGLALVAVERCDLAVDKAPVDLLGQLRQLVLQIDDLIEPRPEQIVRTRRLVLVWPHRALRCGKRIMLCK
jgi:hypothetical protein